MLNENLVILKASLSVYNVVNARGYVYCIGVTYGYSTRVVEYLLTV
jgi:hypothetical protein